MSKAGRPTVITPKVVSQLEALLSVGLTVREACLESEISHEAYYSRVRSDDQFADKMAKAQNTVTTTAKKVVATQVLGGDTKTSMWWLDRLDKKELAKLQLKEPQDQLQPDEEHEPAPLEELIDDFLMHQRFIASAYELRKDADGERLNVDEFHKLSIAERCEKAVTEFRLKR